MNYHDQIMNLQTEQNKDISYKLGHKNARHAAAEIALKADAEIEQLLEALISAKDLAEFWINQDTQEKSKQEYRIWLALGHQSKEMQKICEALAATDKK